MELRSTTIANTIRVKSNMAVVDGATHRLIFLSAIGADSAIKGLVKEVNKRNSIYIEKLGSYGTAYKEYNHFTDRDAVSGNTTAIISAKDKVEVKNGNVIELQSYIYTSLPNTFDMRPVQSGTVAVPEEISNKIYDKLYEHMPTPMIPEWKSYIAAQIARSFLSELRVFKPEDVNFRVFRMFINSNQIEQILQRGLSERIISINGTNHTSQTLSEIEGMNDYLTTYSVQAAEKLQESFRPKFIPNESPYNENLNTLVDYASYKSGIDLYDPQKIVIQATSNNLDKNDVSFIIATPGSGKTILGSASVFTHADKITTNIVMAPGHLVEKWISEIRKIVPLSIAMAVDGFEHFKSLEPLINDPKRRKHLFLVVSKDTVKSTYEKRPAVVWSMSKNAYTCPTCGQKLQKKEYVGTGRNRREVMVDLQQRDFTKEYAHNTHCNNKVMKWNNETKEHEEIDCHENLWTPSIKEDDGRWVRLPKGEGWMEKRHLRPVMQEIIANGNISRTDAKFISAAQTTLSEIANGTLVQRAPRKYSLANYIRRFYKNKIDYLIADELQKYKGGNSLQGQAFGDLVCASRKVICLTGTLLNGYADSLFYILYRAFPRTMKEAGFDYADEKEFARNFGVVRYDDRFSSSASGVAQQRIGNRKEKFLPGVSPLVFTNFLLENAVFLNLEDISDGLPNYEEIPVAVEMDEQLAAAYARLEQDFRGSMGSYGRGRTSNMKIMGAMLQSLSAFPDTPYDQPQVIHPDTGEVVITLPELPKQRRNKEAELLRICQERVAAGEKVLVYYHWTNRTDVEERLPELLQEAGLRTTVLKSSSSNMRDREAWIAERTPQTDVLLCNPTLVETGLDLLDYTSIVFYQVGYDIFTMRQASKRSYRLNQTKDVRVYFLYYQDTIQEQALSLMATKLQASQAIEGNFSEEGLHAMSNNEDLLTQIANSVVQGISHTVDIKVFTGTKDLVVHSNPDESFADALDIIFDEADDAPVIPVVQEAIPVVEEEVCTRRSRIEFSTYQFKDVIAAKPKSRSRKKKPDISASSANTRVLLEQLRSKQIHIMQLA